MFLKNISKLLKNKISNKAPQNFSIKSNKRQLCRTPTNGKNTRTLMVTLSFTPSSIEGPSTKLWIFWTN